MKFRWVTRALAFIAVVVLGVALASAEGLAIVGPDAPVTPMALVMLDVEDVDVETFQAGKYGFHPTEGVLATPLANLEGGIVLVVQCQQAGAYTFRVTVARTAVAPETIPFCEEAEFILTVEGTGPSPPPVPPPVPGERFVIILEETGERTNPQAAVILGLRGWALQNGTRLPILDQNVDNPSRSSPPWLLPYLEAVKTSGQSLPVIIASKPAAGGGVDFAVEPLPATSAAAIEAVKKARGT